MAAELTTPSPIYEIINSRYQLGQEELVQQPSLQGKDFLYFPALHEVPFSPKDGLTNICCVKEDPKRKGDRLVDVLSGVFNKSTQKHLRIMMEIKKGYKQSDLYKLCLKFFSLEKLNSLENSILVFVSTISVREYLVSRLKEEQKAVYTKIESGNYIILDAEDLKNTNLKC
jgi:hypothetical protein